jgi:hypothetical protein
MASQDAAFAGTAFGRCHLKKSNWANATKAANPSLHFHQAVRQGTAVPATARQVSESASGAIAKWCDFAATLAPSDRVNLNHARATCEDQLAAAVIGRRCEFRGTCDVWATGRRGIRMAPR